MAEGFFCLDKPEHAVYNNACVGRAALLPPGKKKLRYNSERRFMKRFNVTGLCVPEEHYMADITGKIKQIKKLVDSRCYFTINRARQYGKTTTLAMLERALENDYIVASISFEGLGDKSFGSSEAFCQAFIKHIVKALWFTSAPREYIDKWVNGDVTDFDLLSDHITDMCENKKVVLMIDEVDKTSNNQMFLHFFGMLREKFLAHANGKDYTFHSVIMAGLYTPAPNENDIIYHSPWNIAVTFTVDMSFCPAEIMTMLNEYETDHNTGMDIAAISEEIHSYTSGYPFLVSRICQCVDEELGKAWTVEGVQNAVKIILSERNILFEDVFKNLKNNAELSGYIYDLLILGETRFFFIYNSVVNIGVRYGFFENANGMVAISNKVFELLMTDYFMEKDRHTNK